MHKNNCNKRGKMPYGNLTLIILLSSAACILYTLMLVSPYNHYFYTSPIKLVLFLAAPIIYHAATKQGKIKDLFRLNGTAKYMKISALLGGATFIFIILAFFALNKLFSKQMILDGLAREGITRATFPYVFVYIVAVNAFLEEFLFRGFVFLTMFNLGFKRFAYIFSSVLFSVYHIAMMNSWFSPPIFLLCLVGLIAAGLIFNELDRRCGNIFGGFFVHFGANFAINLIGVYFLYIAL